MPRFSSAVLPWTVSRKEISMIRFSFILAVLLMMGCGVSPVSETALEDTGNPVTREEARQLAIECIDGVIALAQTAGRSKRASGDSSLVLVYVKGDATGSGAVITEKHETVKGVRIVETRTVVGNGPIHPRAITTTVKKFLSEQRFLEDRAATTRTTAVYGEDSGTGAWIATHVERDGRELRVTFRSPIITVRDQKTTIRRGSPIGIEIVTEEGGIWLKTQYVWGGADGSTNRSTLYPGGLWDQVSVRGEADGSVTRTYGTER